MNTTGIPSGLTAEQASESRRMHGPNVFTPKKKSPWWREFLHKFSDPLIIILLVAGVLSIGIACYEHLYLGHGLTVFFEPAGIFIAIMLATGLAFLFEERANKAFQVLNKANDDEPVEVIRDSSTVTVPRRDVVVGDIVVLNTGDEVPADGQLLDAVTLSIDESSLTGEPLAHKTTDPTHFDKEATYPSDRVMRGTKVMEGHGLMRVDKVGDATEMGKVYEDAQIDDTVRTPLNLQLDRLARWITAASYTIAALVIAVLLIQFMGWGHWQSWTIALPVFALFYLAIAKFKDWSKSRCATAIVVLIIIFFAVTIGAFAMLNPDASEEQWSALLSRTLHTLMVAVTLIVVAVPEGLPMAVTLSLAYSMGRMLKTNNLVRKMHACETMGASTVICTDKTGTLTQNLMQVADTRFYGDTSSAIISEGIAANSTATLSISDGKPQALGNPTEGALLLWLFGQGIDFMATRSACERIAELPFSTERKYMATIVRSAATGHPTLYVKGAPEIVLGLCSDIAGGAPRQDIEAQLLAYQQQAMRTLGFAMRELHPQELDSISADAGIRLSDFGALTFLGIAAISDPVRPDVPAAVKECLDAGISVKIVTGDTPATAREIARQIGLYADSDPESCMITGPEFAALSDQKLSERVLGLKIISRARPADKKRLVEALQAKGQVVAVTGDGTNDAPALKAAHVGLSMGDGTSVAKEASDITIIDNSFSSIGRAVMWGRSLYQNIQRFLLFQLTVNVAACLLVLVGSCLGAESPLTVTQMLWINLIMDTFGAMALASLPPSPDVMRDRPRDRNASILTRTMMVELMCVGTIFFAITLALYWIFTHYHVTSMLDMLRPLKPDPEGVMTEYEGTLLFSVFVWTHFWYMFDARCFETGRSVFALKMSQGFWLITAIIFGGQLFITEIAYEFFNVEPMLHTLQWKFNPSGATDLAIIIAASSLVLWVRELAHQLFHNK